MSQTNTPTVLDTHTAAHWLRCADLFTPLVPQLGRYFRYVHLPLGLTHSNLLETKAHTDQSITPNPTQTCDYCKNLFIPGENCRVTLRSKKFLGQKLMQQIGDFKNALVCYTHLCLFMDQEYHCNVCQRKTYLPGFSIYVKKKKAKDGNTKNPVTPQKRKEPEGFQVTKNLLKKHKTLKYKIMKENGQNAQQNNQLRQPQPQPAQGQQQLAQKIKQQPHQQAQQSQRTKQQQQGQKTKQQIAMDRKRTKKLKNLILKTQTVQDNQNHSGFGLADFLEKIK